MKRSRSEEEREEKRKTKTKHRMNEGEEEGGRGQEEKKTKQEEESSWDPRGMEEADDLSFGGLSPVVALPPTLKSDIEWNVGLNQDNRDTNNSSSNRGGGSVSSASAGLETSFFDDASSVVLLPSPSSFSHSPSKKRPSLSPEGALAERGEKGGDGGVGEEGKDVKIDQVQDKDIQEDGDDDVDVDDEDDQDEGDFFLDSGLRSPDDQQDTVHRWPREKRTKITMGVAIANMMESIVSSSFRTTMMLIAQDFGSGIFSLTYSICIFSLAMGLFTVAGAPLSDLYSRRWVIIGGLFASSIFSVLLSLSWSFIPVILFRALQGVFLAPVFLVCTRIISDSIPILERQTVFVCLVFIVDRSQSIHQSINQSINPSIHQSINQSVNQSINQSFNQSINQQKHKLKRGGKKDMMALLKHIGTIIGECQTNIAQKKRKETENE